MTNHKPKISIKDKKGRILLSVMETSTGKDRWIFHRYVDMSDQEKAMLSIIFNKMCKSSLDAVMLDGGKKTPIQTGIDDFLSFEDQPEFCG